MSKLGLLLFFWEGKTRVHGAVLLELHHFSGALPPFGAAVCSADLTAVLGLKSCPVAGGWELAGSVPRGDPCGGIVTPRGSVSPGCQPLGLGLAGPRASRVGAVPLAVGAPARGSVRRSWRGVAHHAGSPRSGRPALTACLRAEQRCCKVSGS